ncbi:DMT family transporter [Dechloromonas agitata]|uniref:DMT family transporter n=1 Tax=Dechloromonas agitata TaxID=73030 RepID=A0A930BV79_9RHOO|nr:DMT family transporter [Dechloromonas agitata]MBF1165831.1 DMT family transporter [Dechloromonas agitata]MDE1544315.1 DMT family transporter [Dechloromonas agitata]
MPKPASWGLLLALLAAFGFSLKAIFIKLAYPYGVDAITLLALRMGFALPVFLWVGLAEHKAGAALSRQDWGKLLALGCLGYYGASILDFWGLEYISAGLERLILFTYPTLTILIGVLFQGKPFTRREGIAIVLCYTGIGFAFLHDLNLGEPRSVLIGGALVFASSVSYALYLAGSAPMIGRLGAMRFAALAMLFSTAVTLGHFMAAQPFTAFIQPLPVYGWALAMALFATVIPVFALSAAIRRIGAGQASLFGMVGPILTIGFGWWLLGEPISAEQSIGAIFVVVGILIVSRR